MNRQIVTGVCAGALLAMAAVPGTGQAQSGYLDDLVYYEIGGGQALRGPAGYGRHARIRGDASLSLGYSCGRFDLEQNLRQMFGRFTGGLDRAVDSLMFAATGAVASLPLYILRQANPNLANMLENTMLRYEEEYNLAVKSCREAEREILAGENPYYDWVRFGQRDTWRKSAGTGRTADEVEEMVADQHGCVTWIDDEYFCDDGDSRKITVVEDVAREGYRRIADIDAAAGGAPAGAPESRMRQIWPTADDAAEDILDITGETVITNTRTTPPEGRPPRGIGPAMHEDARETREALDQALERVIARDTPTQDELGALGVPGLTITPRLLWTIGKLEPGLRATAIERISGEIALLRAMEKVNLARRILLTGSRLPE
ncbi:MAG: hypothetical protein F4103_04840, partial [Boseongicola sp. SB0673_bin_14]|nr:hypothetical protein [Boseongicola sp. SB0673_bin_14]